VRDTGRCDCASLTIVQDCIFWRCNPPIDLACKSRFTYSVLTAKYYDATSSHELDRQGRVAEVFRQLGQCSDAATRSGACLTSSVPEHKRDVGRYSLTMNAGTSLGSYFQPILPGLRNVAVWVWKKVSLISFKRRV
jgi:hypothetical protein